MAQADDQETPAAERPEAAEPASSFWRRYTGRARSDGESAAEADAEAVGGGAETGAGSGTVEGEADSDATEEQVPPFRSLHGDAPHNEGHQCLDWCPICRGADFLREAVPPELQDQFRIVQRDALLFAQAMIEAHLARLKQDAAQRPESDVSSIPID